jgi:hypothetical protein
MVRGNIHPIERKFRQGRLVASPCALAYFMQARHRLGASRQSRSKNNRPATKYLIIPMSFAVNPDPGRCLSSRS